MLVLRGNPALSPFRKVKRLEKVRLTFPQVSDLEAEYVHFVDVARDLAEDQRGVLDRLLEYGPRRDPVRRDGKLVLVVPRVGTTSPWSSKATDIAHNCGLNHIRRIERGCAWYVTGADDLSTKVINGVAELLHDRMTESLLFREEDAAVIVSMKLDTMEAVHDGLHVLAETLHAMCLPYPPPPVPPKRNDHLKLVE